MNLTKPKRRATMNEKQKDLGFLPTKDEDYYVGKKKENLIDPEDLLAYKCHKEVRARKIDEVVQLVGDDGEKTGEMMIGFKDLGFLPVDDTADYVSKHNPHQGGYYVVYEDGYESFSPASAFEQGYRRLSTSSDGKPMAPSSLVNKRRKLRQAVIEAAKKGYFIAEKGNEKDFDKATEEFFTVVGDLINHEEKTKDKYDELSFPAIEMM